MIVFQSEVFETGVFGTSSMTLNKTKVYLGDAEIMQIVHGEDLVFKTMPQDAEVAPNIDAIALSTLGPVKVGDTVRVSGVTYRNPPQPTPVLSYQWRLDGSIIAGATASEHRPASAGLLSCAVAAENAAGSDTKESAQVRVENAAGFTPLSLNTAGREIYWYDPQDDTTLWQDTAGTSQVTTDSQTVARVDDKGPNGINIIQSDSGLRPTRTTINGKRHLQFPADGKLVSAAASVAMKPTVYVVVAFRPTSTTGSSHIGMAGLASDADNYVSAQYRNSNRLTQSEVRNNGTHTNRTSSPAVAWDGTTQQTSVQTSIFKPTGTANVVCQLNQQANTTTGEQPPSVNAFVGMMGSGITGVHPTAYQAQLVIVVCDGGANELTAQELDDLENYVRERAGAEQL